MGTFKRQLYTTMTPWPASESLIHSEVYTVLNGTNKSLPENFELQALLALSHYPELKDIRIEFHEESAMIPLSSRPRIKSLLRNKSKRIYKVVISNKSLEEMEDILLDKQPFNSQVGIIGHELAHTGHYSTMGFFSITGMGIAYIFPGYRARYEKVTDFETIKHGLGWQLLEFAEFTRSRPSVTEKSIRWMDKYYLNPEEIKMFMDEMPELYISEK